MVEKTPITEVCERPVTIPTVTGTFILEHDRRVKIPAVQWFGQADEMVDGLQFAFPINIPEWARDLSILAARPDWYKVAFLGQIKDWSIPDVAEELAQSMANGDADAWIAWLLAPGHASIEQPQGLSDAVQLVLSADPNVNIISPQPYVNLNVVDETLNARVVGIVFPRSQYNDDH